MTPNKDRMAIEDYINDESYKAGVDSFLDFAFQKLGTETIRCPCLRCLNIETGDRDKVRNHLLVYGIVKRYTFWYHHGERRDEP
ncbi:Claudin-8 [Bienertia sinuspersici]